MRIAFSGTANSGKTTLIKSFLHTWDNYTTPKDTYRDHLEKSGVKHSSKTTTKTQTTILDFLVDQIQGQKPDANIVYDRCPLDAIAYSMWANEKGLKGFTEKFVKNQINMAKESLRSLDIIFMTRFNDSFAVVDDGTRDINVKYIREVDNIFYSLYKQYMAAPAADVFFPKDDSPCIIMLPDSGQARINLIAEYVTPDGDMYGEEESILNPNNLDDLERLVRLQKDQLDQEDKEKALFEKFGINSKTLAF
jgi:predicted ATPase